MDRDNQQIPGFGFDPGYEPAPHPVQAAPNSSSIFGLISKVNKGILKSPQSSDQLAVPVTPAVKQAKAVAENFVNPVNPSASKQKAFQNAKTVIENIQRGIWNPPNPEQRRPNESGFKVPMGLPKTKTALPAATNTSADSSGYQGYYKNQQSKQHVVANAIPKSLVAYEDDDPMKKSSNFSRERALEEIDRYRGPSTNQRRDFKNEASRKSEKEPYKSDFDRYYYGDRSQGNEMSTKIYGTTELSNINQDESREQQFNDSGQDHDYDDYNHEGSAITSTSYKDYQYEEEKESSPSLDRNYCGSVHESSCSAITGAGDMYSRNSVNKYAKSSANDSKETYNYGHMRQTFGRYDSYYESNRPSGDKATPYKNVLSSDSNRNQSGSDRYSNEYSRGRGNYGNQYGRNEGYYSKGMNSDKYRSDNEESNNKMDKMNTQSTSKSREREELYENYLFGEDEGDRYEPVRQYNTQQHDSSQRYESNRDSPVEYIPTPLRNRHDNPNSYSSASIYSKNTPHTDVKKSCTESRLTTTIDDQLIHDWNMPDDQKAKVAGKPGLDSSYKPVSAMTALQGVPAPVPAPVSAPVASVSIAPPGLYCKDCCVTCPDQKMFDSHLKSDQHILTLQKKAQELFQMEARPSRFDTDSSGNPLKAAVLSSTVSSGESYNDDKKSVKKGRRSESPTRYRNRSDNSVQVIPPKPLGPLETRSVHTTMVTIQWRKRHDEEEKLIDKYVVEYRNAREIRWVRVGTTVKHEYEINGLQEDTDYLFRVYTTNHHEKSDFLESVLITTKKRRGFSPVRGRRRSSRERDHTRRSSKESDHKPSRERESRLSRDRPRHSSDDRERRSSRERGRRRSRERDTAGSKDKPRSQRDSKDDKSNRGRKSDNIDDERTKENQDQRKSTNEKSETLEKNADEKSDQTTEISSNPANNESRESTEVCKESESKTNNNTEDVECLLYAEFDNYEDEPMLGLDHIYEIRSYSATIPPRYVCKLCNNKGSHNIIVRHIIGFPHKLNYFKQYDPEVYDLINMMVVKKQQVERANQEARFVEDKIGRGSVRVMMMLNPHDNDGKIVYKDPILVKAPPPKRKKEADNRPDSDEIVYHSQFDMLYNDAVETGYLQDTTLIGLNYVKEIIHPTQEKDSKFNCTMCNVICWSSTILNHIVGKRHRFNYLRVYHEDIYNQVYNARENKHDLLMEKIKLLAEKDGKGSIKVKIAKNDKLWKDKNEKTEETLEQGQEEDDGDDYTEHVQEETMETEEEDVQARSSVPAIKFDIKKNDPHQTNVNPINVLELDKSQKSKDVFDWNKENGLLQSRIQNESIVKSSRKSKFITVYSEVFKRIPVIGMQWVTEFQRPDPKAEPWYMCFMCQQKFQWKSILDHVTSNLHRLNYMKKNEYRQKYNAVYNVIKTNKQEARPMIETFSKEILNIEGPPTDIQVMLELQVNTEAFKSVAKVQENVKAHASIVATTSSSSIQINIATTSLPHLESLQHKTSPIASNATTGSEVQTSTVQSSQSWTGGQPLTQGPSGVCPLVPPPMLPTIRMQVSSAAIPQQTVPVQIPPQHLSYPTPSNTAGFSTVKMPNIYAPPLYPNQGLASMPVTPNFPMAPSLSVNRGQVVPSSSNIAVPVRGLAPNVPAQPPTQPIVQQAVPNSRPLIQNVPVTQIAPPILGYQPGIQGPALGQTPQINQVTAVHNLPSSNTAALVSTIHSLNTQTVRPLNVGTIPPWQQQQNQVMSNQVEPRQMLNPRPLMSLQNPGINQPPVFASKTSTVSGNPVSINTNTYTASSNSNVPDNNREYSHSNINSSGQSTTSSEKVEGFNYSNRNNSTTGAKPNEFTHYDVDFDNTSSRGLKRVSEETELFDRVKMVRSDDRHSSSPHRDFKGRSFQEGNSRFNRERDNVGRRDIHNRQDNRRGPDPRRSGTYFDDREKQRGQDNNRRQASSPPRRRWSKSPPRRRHSRSPPLRRRSSRSPPVRRRFSRSPPSRKRSASPPHRAERRSPYQQRGREDNFTQGSRSRLGMDFRKDMCTHDTGADRYLDDRYENSSAPLDKTEVDDLVRRYSDRVDDEYEFGAGLDNYDSVCEMYEGNERERNFKGVGSYYDAGSAQRENFRGQSRNDGNMNENQYRSDRSRDFSDRTLNRYNEFNEFKKSSSQESDNMQGSRKFDSRRNISFSDNSKNIDSYRDNNRLGKYLSDDHGNFYQADGRNPDNRYNDRETLQEYRKNQDDRSNNRGLRRHDSSRRDKIQTHGYNTSSSQSSRQRDDRRTGYHGNRDDYHSSIDEDAADRFDDRMPDPSREEIEALLRRATTMVTPPPDEFEHYQINDQTDNLGHHMNTERRYNERSLNRQGNTDRGSYGSRSRR